MYHISFIHSSVGGRLGCSHFLSVVEKATGCMSLPRKWRFQPLPPQSCAAFAPEAQEPPPPSPFSPPPPLFFLSLPPSCSVGVVSPPPPSLSQGVGVCKSFPGSPGQAQGPLVLSLQGCLAAHPWEIET